ncbi:hypothetical protein GGR44_000618 [Sphingobium fontiphilum]|uniref:Uncharacterized protein n=1 Tax=Sphingobium fontiphilum TaxID=944425 RepID=A0A7W6GMZ4_9SPHN|nr:hypothetical protein [Sphingobium fontiphilum]
MMRMEEMSVRLGIMMLYSVALSLEGEGWVRV